MPITLEEVEHVAKLARLELEPSELLVFQGELNALLGHFIELQAINTAGLEPKPHAVSLSNIWADDEAAIPMSREDALRNSRLSRAGLFVVPAIIEE